MRRRTSDALAILFRRAWARRRVIAVQFVAVAEHLVVVRGALPPQAVVREQDALLGRALVDLGTREEPPLGALVGGQVDEPAGDAGEVVASISM